MNIKEFRTKYPTYNDMSDIELARKLHVKDYADIPFEDFATRFGVKQPRDVYTSQWRGFGAVPIAGRELTEEERRRREVERPFEAEVGALLAKSFMDVGAGYTGTVAGAMREEPRYSPMMSELFGVTEEEHKELRRGLQTATEKIRSAQEHFQRTWEGPGGWALETVTNAVGYMGAALAGGYIAGPVGAAVTAFSVEGQNAYDEAIKRGATETQADTDRVIVGSLNAAIEALQIGRLMKFQKTGKHSIVAFKDLLKKKAYKELIKAGGKFTKEVLKNAIEEGAEEFLQEGVSISVPAILRGEYPKKADGSPDVWAIGERLGAAYLGGAVAGGVLGAGGAVTLAAPTLAAPSAMRVEELAERIHSDQNLGEVEKAMMLRDLKEVLPEGHPALKEGEFPPGTVQVYRGKETGKIYPETPGGGQTRMEEVGPQGPRIEEGTPDWLAQIEQEIGGKLTTPKAGESPLETIVGVASRYKGEIFTGVTHAEAWHKAAKSVGKEDLSFSRFVEDDLTYTDGFITNTGRFVSREEATQIVDAAKQYRDKSQEELHYTDLTPPQTRIVSIETGEELVLDKELTAKATKEARPPTIFDIPEATQKTLDAAKKVSDVLLELEPMRKELKEKMEAKRHAIWAATEDIVKKLSPEQGHIYARKRAMAHAKQTLREVLPDIKNRITNDEHESLVRAINEASTLNEGQKMNLTETLKELFVDGTQPDKSHIKLFDQFFGTRILETAREMPPKKWWKKWLWYVKEGLLEGMGAVKASVTSFDLSAGGIQAWPNFFVNPKQWWIGEGVGIRAALSNKYSRLLDIEMKTDPDYKRIVMDGGLPITEVGSLTEGEELFRRGHFAQKIPAFGKGVAASERAYVANLNYQRFAVAKKVLESWDGEEVSYAKDRELMDHIGNMTGRGKGKPSGWFEKFMELWSFGFWSPRLYKAVVNLPVEFISKPHIRKIAAHDAVQFFGLMGLVTFLASLIPGVEREDDPRSTDFWKLKYGNTRYNPMGRYQQLARLVGQLWTGEVKSSTTGRIYEKEDIDILTRYLRGKLAPGPGMAWDVMIGETYRGEKLTWDEASITKYIAEHVSPLFLQDMVDALRFQGLDSSTPFTFGLGVAGIGTQTYDVTPKQEEVEYKNKLAQEYFGQEWDQIGEEAQVSLRAGRPSIADYERAARFEQDDMSIRGVIAQEALNAGNRVQRTLPKKVQDEMETLQVRIGELKRYSGKGWYLNQLRFKQFQNEMSEILSKWTSAMVDSKSWAAIPVEGKRTALEHAISESRKIAWQKVKSQANADDFKRLREILNERETTGTVAVK